MLALDIIGKSEGPSTSAYPLRAVCRGESLVQPSIPSSPSSQVVLEYSNVVNDIDLLRAAVLWLRRAIGWTAILVGVIGTISWFGASRRSGLFMWTAMPANFPWNFAMECCAATGQLSLAAGGALLLRQRRMWFWVMRVGVLLSVVGRTGEWLYNQSNFGTSGNILPDGLLAPFEMVCWQLTVSIFPEALFASITLLPIARVLTRAS